MLTILRNRPYRHLFLAQVIALLGTGLATVSLGLLAFDIAGADAGAVLGTALGVGYSLVQTPSGRLLRRSSHEEDRPALLAAQFALSHACWLLAYPMAGWLGARAGMSASFLALGLAGEPVDGAVVTGVARHRSAGTAARAPPPASGHPHMANAPGHHHSHAFVIDDEHPHWPA